MQYLICFNTHIVLYHLGSTLPLLNSAQHCSIKSDLHFKVRQRQSSEGLHMRGDLTALEWLKKIVLRQIKAQARAGGFLVLLVVTVDKPGKKRANNTKILSYFVYIVDFVF